MGTGFSKIQADAEDFDVDSYERAAFVQSWYRVPTRKGDRWVPQSWLCVTPSLAVKVLSEWFERCDDRQVTEDFRLVVPNPRRRVKLFVMKEVTLRSSLQLALTCIPEACRRERQILQDLLDQRSDSYGTLTHECEVALYG